MDHSLCLVTGAVTLLGEGSVPAWASADRFPRVVILGSLPKRRDEGSSIS